MEGADDPSALADTKVLEQVRRAVERQERKHPTVEGDEDHAGTDLQAKMVSLVGQVAQMLALRQMRNATRFDKDLFEELHGVVERFGFSISVDEVGTRLRVWMERGISDPGEREESKKDCITVFGGPTNFAVKIVSALHLIPGSSAGSLFNRKSAYRAAARTATRMVAYRDLALFMLACLDVPRIAAVPVADLLTKIRSGRAAFGSDRELAALKESLKQVIGTPGSRLPPVAFVRDAQED